MSKNPPLEEYLTNLPAGIQAITRELVALARMKLFIMMLSGIP